MEFTYNRMNISIDNDTKGYVIKTNYKGKEYKVTKSNYEYEYLFDEFASKRNIKYAKYMAYKSLRNIIRDETPKKMITLNCNNMPQVLQSKPSNLDEYKEYNLSYRTSMFALFFNKDKEISYLHSLKNNEWISFESNIMKNITQVKKKCYDIAYCLSHECMVIKK